MKLGIACFLCVLTANCFALDREAFTFTNYDLRVRVEPEQQRLGVRGQIRLRNDSGSAQKNAVLQISSSLSWRSIQIDGTPLQFVTQPYQTDVDHTGAVSEAIVTLPREIPPKGAVDLEIGYEGTIPLDTTRLTRIGTPKEIAARADWDQIGKQFSAVRGIGYVAWYPVATESANLSEGNTVFETVGKWKARETTAEVHLDLCQEHQTGAAPTLVANGRDTGGSSGGIGAGHSVLPESGRPNTIEDPPAPLSVTSCTHYLFPSLGATIPSFVVGNYETLNRPAANIFYLPGHKPAAEDFALGADLVIPFITEWFGSPRESAEVVELASPALAPYENGRMLLASLAEFNSKLAQVALVHQLAHTAFPSPREWIYEGLAHFAQALYREREDGRQAALDYLGLHRETLAEAEKEGVQSSATSGPKSQSPTGEPLLTTFDEVFYRTKAPYVWWMLRDMIGDDALKKALATYRPEQDKGPSYMQHLIEAQTRRDLGWFFDDWVDKDRGLPDFRVASVYPRSNTQGGYQVTITVENLGGAGAEVPVTLRMESGEITKRLEVRGKASSSIRIEAPSAPVEVVVNDASVPEMDMGNNTLKVETSGK